MRNYIIIFIILIVGVVSCNTMGQLQKETVKAKVIETVAQMKVNKEDTDYRYLVITDKGTFICESSWINGKFNNSDEFYQIKKDSTYTFTVCGWGKTFFTDYRNILTVK